MASPSTSATMAVLGVAVAMTAVPAAWRLTRPLSTLVHEAGHTLVAILSGRKVHAVKLFQAGGGCTTHSGTTGWGPIVTTAAGYPAPPLVGLGLAAALMHDFAAKALLIAAIPVLVLLLVLSRNVFGVLVIALVLGAVGLVLRQLGPGAQSLVVLGLTAYLLLAGLRSSVELWTLVRDGSRGNDASMLARMTRVPALFWSALFIAVSVGSIYQSGRWLYAAAVAKGLA